MRTIFAVISIISFPLQLASCQTDQREAVGLDEAKQVAATFEGKSFTP